MMPSAPGDDTGRLPADGGIFPADSNRPRNDASRPPTPPGIPPSDMRIPPNAPRRLRPDRGISAADLCRLRNDGGRRREGASRPGKSPRRLPEYAGSLVNPPEPQGVTKALLLPTFPAGPFCSPPLKNTGNRRALHVLFSESMTGQFYTSRKSRVFSARFLAATIRHLFHLADYA
jgi:hypothetical protein